MKKILTIASVLALFGLVFVGCASKDEVTEAAAEAPAYELPTEPVELVLGTDYVIEPVFGDKFEIADNKVSFFKGSANNNHAILFKLNSPELLVSGSTITINFTMLSYDETQSAQWVIQPADPKNADYSAQSYPILYNSLSPEENTNSITIEVSNLLKSSVKKNLCGFRFLNNTGSWEKFVWQPEYSVSIDSVIYTSAAN